MKEEDIDREVLKDIIIISNSSILRREDIRFNGVIPVIPTMGDPTITCHYTYQYISMYTMIVDMKEYNRRAREKKLNELGI